MKEHSTHPFIGLIFGLIFFGVGIYCLSNPRKLQKRLLKFYQLNPKVEQSDPFSNYVKSPNYRIGIVFVGITAVLAGSIALVASMSELLVN